MIHTAKLPVGAHLLCALLLVFGAACNQSIPPSKQQHSVEKAIVTPKALSQRAARIEGAWGIPENIGQETIDNNLNGFIHGPKLLLDNDNNAFARWRLLADLNLQTGVYATKQTRLLHRSATDGIWQNVNQIPNADLNGTVFPLVEMHQASGNAYLLLEANGNLNLRHYDKSLNWSDNVLLGKGQRGTVSVINATSAHAVWVNALANNQIVLSITRYDRSTGLEAPATLTRGDVSDVVPTQIKRVTVASDEAGNALVVWLEKRNNTESLWSAYFTANIGWDQPQQLPSAKINSVSTLHDFILSNNPVTNGSELVFVTTGFSGNRIYALSYDGNVWRNEIVIDENPDLNSFTELDVAMSTNQTGEIIVVWNEKQEINNEVFYSLQQREFTPQNGWLVSSTISSLVLGGAISADPLVPVAHLANPAIAMNENGEKSVVWIEYGTDYSELFVNHSGTDKNWGTPEVIVAYNSAEGSVSFADVALNASGVVHVLWSQDISKPLVTETNFWSSQHTGNGTVTPAPPAEPPVNGGDIPLPAATWTPPVEIWNDTLLTNIASQINGPDLSISEAGNRFLALHRSSDFDPQTGGYLNREGVVLSSLAPDVWSPDLPFAVDANVNLSDVEITMVKATGNAYAIWSSNGELYINYFVNGTGWDVPVLVDFNNGEHELLLDANNDALLYWVFDSNINVTKFVPGTGLQTIETSSATNALFFAPPVLDSAGNVVAAWVSLPDFTSQPFRTTNDLQVQKFIPGTGWDIVQTAPPFTSINHMGSFLRLETLENEKIVAISQDVGGAIFATSVDPANGWAAWENVDYNITKNDAVSYPPSIDSNGTDLMMVWSERTIDVNGDRIYRVYSNRYDPAGDANGVHWPTPERVAAIIPVAGPDGESLHQQQTSPDFVMLPDGRSMAIWLDSTIISSSLIANFYTPGTGWATATDTIVSYDSVATGKVRSPDLEVTDGGTAIVVWRQLISNEFANEHHVWITEGQI